MVARDRVLWNAPRMDSPGPDWDAVPLAGNPGRAQLVWRRECPGSVELRIRLDRGRVARLLAEVITLSVGSVIGIAIYAYWRYGVLSEMFSFALYYVASGGLTLLLIRGVALMTSRTAPAIQIYMSDTEFRVETPNAPLWRRYFRTAPGQLMALRMRPEPWYRKNHLYNAIRGNTHTELGIQREHGAEFILSRLDPNTAEAAANEISARTGLPVHRE